MRLGPGSPRLSGDRERTIAQYALLTEAAPAAAASRSARHAAAAVWPGDTLIMPSLKANTSLALRRILNEEHLGCDVFGPGELGLALRAGVTPEQISLNGSTKGDSLLATAVARDVRVTVDSLDELVRLRAVAGAAHARAAVRLRVRPWLPDSAAASDFTPNGDPAHVAVQDYRAGIPDEHLDAALELAHRSPELELRGLMGHVSRQTTDLGFWRAHARELGRHTVTACRRLAGWRPCEIDVGGGFAPPRDPTGRGLPERAVAPYAPTPAAYAQALVEGLYEGLAGGSIRPEYVRLELEPGRAVYANAGLYLTRVLHVKRQRRPLARSWVETDTSEAFLADLLWEHSRFRTVIANDVERPPGGLAAITGISCGFDVLDPMDRRPEATPGDVLAFLDTGAYQDATSSNFNAMPRPATVLVRGEEARVIKRAETIDDLLAREVVGP